MTRFRSGLAALFLTAGSSAFALDLPAFPGAEGFGALTTGGRGGEVVHVTNLNDKGPGSFRDAVSQPNRIVVFDVGGIIKLESQVVGSDNITIAGQTAPGEGILLYGTGLSFSGKKNVIVRHLRIRSSINASRGSKTLNVTDGGQDMIFDHLSISWGRWDNMGITKGRGGEDDATGGQRETQNITVQDCLIGEAIDPQRFGALIDSTRRITVARTLWTNHSSRNPKGKADMQYINNVVYNFGGTGYAGGHSGAEWNQDLINNYFIAGPSSKNSYAGGFSKTDIVYQTGNKVDLDKDGKLNGVDAKEEEFKPQDTPQPTPPTFRYEPFNKPPVEVTVMSAEDAVAHITQHAGAYLHRDKTDTRLINQLKSFGTEGEIIKTEETVGGPGEVKGAEPAKDSDKDGIPDAWESANGLNPEDPMDSALISKSGYANIELYVNSLLPAPKK